MTSSCWLIDIPNNSDACAHPDGCLTAPVHRGNSFFWSILQSAARRAGSGGRDRPPPNVVRHNSVNPEFLSSNEGAIRVDRITSSDAGRLGGIEVWANTAVFSELVHDSGDHTQLPVPIIGCLVASAIYRIVVGIRTIGIGVSVPQANIRRLAVMHVGDFGIEKRSL